MKNLSVVCALAGLALVGCGERKPEGRVSPASAPEIEVPVPVAPEPWPVLPAPSEEARAAYQAMEDRYIGDPKAQWAESASSGYTLGGQSPDVEELIDANVLQGAVGAVDGRVWQSSHEREGVDWLQLHYARPMRVGAVRVAMVGRPTVKSITRVDLVDEAGEVRTAWTGVSEVAEDLRGNRTWFIRKLEPTDYKVVGVKLFFGHKLAPGPKQVDAVQLVEP